MNAKHIILFALIAVTLVAHLVTATNYPMFRDEFYYLECANHLDWGYVDHPAFSIVALAGWRSLFGDSLFVIRLLPALCAALLIFLIWKITEELGGGTFACTLAGLAALISPEQRAITGFYSMNAFDLVFWVAAFWVLIRIVKTGNPRLWIPFGVVAGLGLLNKIGLLFLGAGLVAGMILTRLRKHFALWHFWVGGAIAVLLFLPYVLWQFSHEFATLEFVHNASTFKNVAFAPHEFLLEFALENNPLTLVIWGTGLIALLVWTHFRDYRTLGWIAVVVFAILMAQHGKPYYAAGLLPLLLPAGAVRIEHAFSNYAWARVAALIVLAVSGLALLPFGLRMLTPEQFIAYQNTLNAPLQPSERGHFGSVMPQIYSDSFGWEELVNTVANVYHSLPPDEKADCAIIASNYGEAGAIDYFGPALGLPNAYSTNNNYYFWGPPHVTDNTTYIVIVQADDVDPHELLDSLSLVATHDHPLAMPYECNLNIYVGKGLKHPINDLWRRLKDFY